MAPKIWLASSWRICDELEKSKKTIKGIIIVDEQNNEKPAAAAMLKKAVKSITLQKYNLRVCQVSSSILNIEASYCSDFLHCLAMKGFKSA